MLRLFCAILLMGLVAVNMNGACRAACLGGHNGEVCLMGHHEKQDGKDKAGVEVCSAHIAQKESKEKDGAGPKASLKCNCGKDQISWADAPVMNTAQTIAPHLGVAEHNAFLNTFQTEIHSLPPESPPRAA